MCSGITHGRVFNRGVGGGGWEGLYAQRLEVNFYPHLFTDWFMKISPQQIQLY